MPKTNIRAFQVLVASGALAVSLVTAPVAFASTSSAAGNKPKKGEVYNSVVVDINGGKAVALSTCVTYAQLKIKHQQKPKSNTCANFAKATGGDVKLVKTNLTIIQEGSGGETFNEATVNIHGGDATALASCVNFLQGSASQSEKIACSTTAVAQGGDVILKDTDINIIQSGGG